MNPVPRIDKNEIVPHAASTLCTTSAACLSLEHASSQDQQSAGATHGPVTRARCETRLTTAALTALGMEALCRTDHAPESSLPLPIALSGGGRKPAAGKRAGIARNGLAQKALLLCVPGSHSWEGRPGLGGIAKRANSKNYNAVMR